MAGADPTGAFNSTAFRSQIHSVMTMALPGTQSLRPTFQWQQDPTYAVADKAGNPYDWTAAPAANSPAVIADMQVTCAVTYSLDDEFGTDAGEINQQNITITLLDLDYNALVAHGGRQPDRVVCNGVAYTCDYLVHVALFDVDVYQLHASSVDL